MPVADIEIDLSEIDKEIGCVEDLLFEENITRVVGLDEVGMGPLAGPVTVSAVMIECSRLHEFYEAGVYDSKKLSENKRMRISDMIWESCEGCAVVNRDSTEIDARGLADCARDAMADAVELAVRRAGVEPEVVLIDGTGGRIPIDYPQVTIKKGDRLSLHIAAASIIAKVSRDQLLEHYHTLWPEYGFDTNKGYGTQQHIKAIAEHGPCNLHRLTFRKVKQHADRLRKKTP